MALIAGASSALKYREINPRSSDQEVLRHITQESNSIVKGIDDMSE